MRWRAVAGVIACFILVTLVGLWLYYRTNDPLLWPIRGTAFQRSVVERMRESVFIRLVVRSAATPPYAKEIRRIEIHDRMAIDQLANAFQIVGEADYRSACGEYLSVEIVDDQGTTRVFTFADGVIGYRTAIGSRDALVSDRFINQLNSILANGPK